MGNQEKEKKRQSVSNSDAKADTNEEAIDSQDGVLISLTVTEYQTLIDPIHKWLPIKNSFVNIKISPTNLVFDLIIQKNFYFQTRLVGLI